MPLASFDLLGSVVTALLPAYPRGLDRLAIHYGRAGLGVSLRADSHSFAQGRVHPLPRPIQTPGAEVVVDGLITNDKFCFTRRSRLKLRPKRRGYPPRKGVRRGGIDERELDRSAHDGRSQGRRPSLGSGIPAPASMGGPDAPGEPTGGGE